VVASPEILGGHAVEASLLASALRAEGVQVGFVPVDPRLPRALAWVRRIRYLRTLVNQALYLPSLARVGGADVVHVFSASYWSFLLGPAPALLAARVLRKRAILNYHSGEAEDHLGRWGPLVHPWLRLAHEIVVPSEYLRGVFERYGLPARVVPNVVDLSRYLFREREPLRAELLTTRNLEPHYRVEDSIRALELLRARHPQARLTVVGYGSQEAVLRRLAGRLPSGAVRFLGRVQPEAMPRVYDEADVFVNASVVDNQPLSILEAFAAGCPVVTTGPGDIPNMLARGRGLVVPERDPAALAAAVASLLERPSRARELARRAREHVEAHTWNQVRPRWAAVYAGRTS
jgi:glycosyltransferase involved in cell wall biosynthesis